MAYAVKKKLREWLARENPPIVDRAVFDRLFAELGPVAAATLRRHLRESGRVLSPLVEGVRQDSPELLARTLTGLAREYAADSGKQQECRDAVLTAKQHARWAFANRPAPWRKEAIDWMTVWLHDPSLFESWVRLRLAAIQARKASTESRSTEPE